MDKKGKFEFWEIKYAIFSGVEMAIEKDEKEAQDWISVELKKLHIQ